MNVFGEDLEECSCDPLTGWYRDGKCNTDFDDHGMHTVCCQVTDEFLIFLRSMGNDLITPAPQHQFPGLKAGDHWCVCAASWLEAYKKGVACPVNLASTHEETLAVIPLEALKEHALH